MLHAHSQWKRDSSILILDCFLLFLSKKKNPSGDIQIKDLSLSLSFLLSSWCINAPILGCLQTIFFVIYTSKSRDGLTTAKIRIVWKQPSPKPLLICRSWLFWIHYSSYVSLNLFLLQYHTCTHTFESSKPPLVNTGGK